MLKFRSRWSTRFLARLRKVFSFRSLSLKMRLALVFSVLMLSAILFSTLAIFQQHKLALHATDIAVRQYSSLEKAVQLRELLGDLDRSSARADAGVERVSRFRDLLDRLQRSDAPLAERQLLDQLGEEFEAYISVARRPVGTRDENELRERYEETASAVNALVKLKESQVYRKAQDLRDSQEQAMRISLLLLFIFIAVLMVGALKVIAFVTRPLSVLSHFLDGVNVEDDLPQAVPGFQSEVPEISRVARSFEQLLHRLRGYRTLNVRRLLIEKRRADIIAASIADGIFLLRGDEILYVNPVGEKILQLPPGKSWRGLRVGNSGQGSGGRVSDRRRISGVEAVLAATTRTIPVELEVDNGENRKLHYLLQSLPISDEVIEQVEHSFHGPIEQLLDRWQATTLVLAQDVTLVKESQEAKSHFIATLSHEVKTPVTSLTMATRLLKKSIDQFQSPTHRTLIQTCADDVDRLRKLIEDLLSVSRFDTLTQRMDLQRVDLSKLVKQSVQHFQPQAFERGIELSVQYAPEAKSIQVPMDAAKISWAISNLLVNALRHTPKSGKVETFVNVREGFAEVRIQDSGPGIEKNRQDRIFDKFNPFYDLRIARSGSVGMGLAIAREIIVAHGGRIWVVSEPGRGAEFYFSLPIKQNEEGASPGMTTRAGMNLGPIMKGDSSGTSARS